MLYATPMAQRLSQDLPTPPSQMKHPWDEWTDGGTWRLVRGQDFTAQITSFRNRCYGVAKERGMRVTVRTVADGTLESLTVRFFRPEQDAMLGPGSRVEPAAEPV